MTKFIMNPIARLIEVIFLWILLRVNNHGVSLILLSLVVNIILFPLYHIAEKIQQKERAVQEKMKPKLEEFKSVYKGYELYLYTNNVYRINNYHPAYALRGLLSLLIQVPFFMGAFAFLSNYQGFVGVSFLFIKDLSLPDNLLTIGQNTINLLPFIMTGVNLLSGYVYAKGSSTSEKITIVVVALVFLLLLYRSPASLLVYWTFNNVFSLFKNIGYKVVENRKLKVGDVA